MKNRITIYLALVTVLLMALSIAIYLRQDHTAPVIYVPEGETTYREGQDTSVLLDGVSAEDDVDEDLSTSVRIYDVAVLDDGNQALVTYAVYDSSNNLGKATKLVNYIARQNKDNKSENKDSEDEKPEENTSGSTKTTEDESKKTTEAIKDSVDEGYDDPPLKSTGAPVMRLTTHEVRIDVGGYFYSMDYVEDAVDDKDTREYLFKNMYLDSTYDEYTPGVYEIVYFCVDSDGNRSNDAKLKLYVGQDE